MSDVAMENATENTPAEKAGDMVVVGMFWLLRKVYITAFEPPKLLAAHFLSVKKMYFYMLSPTATLRPESDKKISHD